MEKIWIQRYSSGVPVEIDVSSLGSIADYFAAAVSQYGDRRAFVSGSTRVASTYLALEWL